VAFLGRQNRTKPVTAKMEYGFETAGFGLQTGLSGFTGKSDTFGRLTSSAAAAHFNFFVDPHLQRGLRVSIAVFLLFVTHFNRRQITVIFDELTGEGYRKNNDAFGGWLVADYQFLPSHHVGLGLEYTQGLLNRADAAKAFSAHYS